MHNKQQLSEFLSSIDWDYFCTFTTEKFLTIQASRRIAENIAESINAPYRAICNGQGASDIFWSAENFRYRAGVHIHALVRSNLYGFAELREIGKRYGRCSILRAWRGLVENYLSDYVTKKIVDYDFYIRNSSLDNKI